MAAKSHEVAQRTIRVTDVSKLIISHRVAKSHGGVNASKQVAYAWAVSLGGEAGAKLLTKFGLIEQAIDYATECGAFDQVCLQPLLLRACVHVSSAQSGARKDVSSLLPLEGLLKASRTSRTALNPRCLGTSRT